MAVFVERELVARRGRKRATVRIRIHAPRPDSRDRESWECAFDVTVDGERLSGPPKVFGIDGIQALVLALGWVVFTLEQLEDDTGMQLEDWVWIDLWRVRTPHNFPGTRRRAAAIRRTYREYQQKYGTLKRSTSRTAATRRAPAPRAKSAPRKAPRRRRSAPRAS